MHAGSPRMLPVFSHDRRHVLMSAVAGTLPRSAEYAENLAAYLSLVTFWGVILYVALTSALPT